MTETTDTDAPLAPEKGWHPEEFPKLSFGVVTYTCDPFVRPDPSITITPEGWIFIRGGNVQLTIHSTEDWLKLVAMVGRMINSHQAAAVGQAQSFASEPDGEAPLPFGAMPGM